MDWQSIIKSNDRYKDFTILDTPKPFNELFKDMKINLVQLHSTQVIGNEPDLDIVGFCGAFKWVDNMITSLDGDSYYSDTKVLGYNWFPNKDDFECLDILVGEDW